MIPVKTIPGIGKGRNKGMGRGDDSGYDIFDTF
jgi:hypothetical protein